LAWLGDDVPPFNDTPHQGAHNRRKLLVDDDAFAGGDLMQSVAVGQFLNFDELETHLAHSYARSISEGGLAIDLRATEWISVLSVSELFSWAAEILREGGTVEIAPPSQDSFASRFFGSAEIISAFERQGASVANVRQSHFRQTKLATFEHFTTSAAADRYLTELSDHPTAQLLLHSRELPEVVSSGDFARTALRELTDNCFTHGTHGECHYSAIEAAPAPRVDHPLFSSLGGQAYVEICVADRSRKDIIDTLMDSMPPDYTPTGMTSRDKELHPEKRCLLYAFEYNSTSQPNRRLDRVRRLINSDLGGIESIATGLYEVAALARFYRGQVIFRVKQYAGTLDFSKGHLLPRRHIIDTLHRRRLARLTGSIILLRIPAQRVGDSTVVAPPLRLPTRRGNMESVALSVVEDWAASTTDDVEIALAVEQKTLTFLARTLNQEILRGGKRSEVVAVLLDGLDLGTKSFGLLLVLLAQIPRHSKGLLIVVDDSVKMALASEQWNRLIETRDWSRYPSIVLAVAGDSAVTLLGSSHHQEATVCNGDLLRLPQTGLEISLQEIVSETRRVALERRLLMPPVRHSDSLYLIESVYYTPVFFEVRKLLDEPAARRILLHWLDAQIAQVAPTVILVDAPFLLDLVDELSPRQVAFGRVPRVQRVDAANVIKIALAATSTGNERVLLATDVICTARFLTKFLRYVVDPSKITVLAIVDARAGDSPFFAVTSAGPTVDIRVLSALRNAVLPLLDRPEGFDIRDVAIVDSLTRSPTRYPLPERGSMGVDRLLEKAEAEGALAGGHFLFGDSHFSYFVSFRPAFAGLRVHLEAFFAEGAHDISAQPGITPSQVATFCLDEDTGLLEILERSISTTPLPAPRALTKTDLAAPPVRSDRELDAVWCVLPGMASGRTVRQAFEYARSLGPRRIQLYVVVARVEPELMLFHQHITRYTNISTTMRFFCALPLLAYSEGACPICDLGESFQQLQMKVGATRPDLQTLVAERRGALAVVPAQSAAYLGLASSSVTYDGLWHEALLRVAFETADRDPAGRNELKATLQDKAAVATLAAAVGREPGVRVFQSRRVQAIAYTPDLLHEACRGWCEAASHDVTLFERQLRGFAQLSATELRAGLPALFERYRGEPSFFEPLLVEAARTPDLYFDAVEVAPRPSAARVANALDQLRDYLHRGAAGESANPLLALHELRWHLARSTGWGIPLEILRHKVATGDRGIIANAYNRFLHDGLQEAERRLYLVRKSGSLWNRLNSQSVLDEHWASVSHAAGLLQGAIDSAWQEYNTIITAIGELEIGTQQFLQQLDTIAIRPGTQIEVARKLAESSRIGAGPVTIEVDERCPAIAIQADDFDEVVLLILQNAVGRDNSQTNTTVFSVAPMRGTPFVTISVAQQREWTGTRGLEGGLTRVRELLSYYGGTLHLQQRAVKQGEPFLMMRLYEWPLKVEGQNDRISG
jgi:hypothetical protein